MPNNRIIVAAAGSRKTSQLVANALAERRTTLITTYTRDGVAEISQKFAQQIGCVPPHVTLLSWYEFLLREGAKPYQLALTQDRRIRSIDFYGDAPRFIRKNANRARYFLNSRDDLFADRASDFVVAANATTGGAVLRRLEERFAHIMVDEMQDLSGHDFNLLDELFTSNTQVTCVGDPRQGVFSTTTALKNAKYKAANIIDWLNEPARKADLVLEEWNECYRCSQAICDYADALYPKLPRTISKNDDRSGHHGVHFVRRAQVAAYVKEYAPQVLRYDRNADTMGLPGLNCGVVKGHSYQHVLIFPTASYRRYMQTGNLSHAGSVAKMYVAITRAVRSVAIVED